MKFRFSHNDILCFVVGVPISRRRFTPESHCTRRQSFNVGRDKLTVNYAILFAGWKSMKAARETEAPSKYYITLIKGSSR